MLNSFMRVCSEASVGKILIQRDEVSTLPKLFYSKFPSHLKDKMIFLLDPMLATGGSANMAINEILKQGGLIENIVFVTVISCPEGILNVTKLHPNIKIVTAEVDMGLNEKVCKVNGLTMYLKWNCLIFTYLIIF